MVHEPLAVKDAIKIPEAKVALDKEWSKLHEQKVWLLDTVREYQDVKHLAIREKRVVNFGRVYPLCFKKHAENPQNTGNSKGELSSKETTSTTSQAQRHSLEINRPPPHTWSQPKLSI